MLEVEGVYVVKQNWAVDLSGTNLLWNTSLSVGGPLSRVGALIYLNLIPLAHSPAERLTDLSQRTNFWSHVVNIIQGQGLGFGYSDALNTQLRGTPSLLKPP